MPLADDTSHKNISCSYTVNGAFVFYAENNQKKKKKRKTEKVDYQGDFDSDCCACSGLPGFRCLDRAADGKDTI